METPWMSVINVERVFTHVKDSILGNGGDHVFWRRSMESEFKRDLCTKKAHMFSTKKYNGLTKNHSQMVTGAMEIPPHTRDLPFLSQKTWGNSNVLSLNLKDYPKKE